MAPVVLLLLCPLLRVLPRALLTTSRPFSSCRSSSSRTAFLLCPPLVVVVDMELLMVVVAVVPPVLELLAVVQLECKVPASDGRRW